VLNFEKTGFAYAGKAPVLRNLDLRLEAGLLHCVIGPSGCGKTTLLYLAAGLLVPTGGMVSIGGKPVRRGREKTAVILQDHGLFPWKTVYRNLVLPLAIRRVSKEAQQSAALRMLRETGLEGKEKEYPDRLSGGEKQRLAVGRALVQDPDLLLLDEPFSSLDAMTREKMQDWLCDVRSSRPLTLVLVTHSIEEAVFLGDRIHIMDGSGNVHTVSNSPPGRHARKEAQYFDQCRSLREQLERIVAS